MPAGGFALRSRAASGIMSAGITTGARGASAGLGQACLATSQETWPEVATSGVKNPMRAAVERREASAPIARRAPRLASAVLTVRAFRRFASPYFFGGKHQWLPCGQLGCETHLENESVFPSAPAIAGEGDRAKRGGGGAGLDASFSLQKFLVVRRNKRE